MRYMIQHHAVAIDFEALTVTAAAAVGLTTAKVTNRQGCFITVEGGSVKYRFDGSNPTAVLGHTINVGGYLELINAKALQNLRFIALAANATLQVSYY
jgi:hypothetical protein